MWFHATHLSILRQWDRSPLFLVARRDCRCWQSWLLLREDWRRQFLQTPPQTSNTLLLIAWHRFRNTSIAPLESWTLLVPRLCGRAMPETCLSSYYPFRLDGNLLLVVLARILKIFFTVEGVRKKTFVELMKIESSWKFLKCHGKEIHQVFTDQVP